MKINNTAIMKKCGYWVAIASTVVALSGCTSQHYPPDPQDPLERFNRASYSFNKQLDQFILKPVAKTYVTITPKAARTVVTNFFSNLGELSTMANDFLQANGKMGATSASRFVINSTIGIAGLFDVASRMGLEKHYNDLGLTLARWGITTSPYLVIPFIGPSSIRDALSVWPNYRFFSLWPYIDPEDLRYGLFALDVVNLRGTLIGTEKIANQASLDEYIFVRNAYLQKRESLIARNAGKTDPRTNADSADPLDELDDLDLADDSNPTVNSDTTATPKKSTTVTLPFVTLPSQILLPTNADHSKAIPKKFASPTDNIETPSQP